MKISLKDQVLVFYHWKYGTKYIKRAQAKISDVNKEIVHYVNSKNIFKIDNFKSNIDIIDWEDINNSWTDDDMLNFANSVFSMYDENN